MKSRMELNPQKVDDAIKAIEAEGRRATLREIERTTGYNYHLLYRSGYRNYVKKLNPPLDHKKIEAAIKQIESTGQKPILIDIAKLTGYTYLSLYKAGYKCYVKEFVKSKRYEENKRYRNRQKQKIEQALYNKETYDNKHFLLYDEESEIYKRATGETELTATIKEMIGNTNKTINVFTLIKKVRAEIVVVTKKMD